MNDGLTRKRIDTRRPELDSIRGIAAFVVILHHCWQMLLPDENTFPFGPHAPTSHLAAYLALSPLRLVFNGHAAVGLFFVLSGYVLMQSLTGTKVPTYGQFVVRRICRIWLPFVAAILFAGLLRALIDPAPLTGRAWINTSWNTPLTLKLILGHLAMIGISPYDNLDNPMWSLAHEMRISLVFPLLAAITIWRPRAVFGCALVGLVTLSARHIVLRLGATDDGDALPQLIYSLIQTCRYGSFFVLGILLARREVSFPQATLWWCAAFALLWLPYVAAIIDVAYAFGSFLLIALCIQSSSARAILSHALPRWLGQISYSLYLLHLPILLAFEHTLHGRLADPVILLLAIPTSCAVAHVSYRFIELPSIKLGKSISARMAALRAPGPAADGLAW